MSVHPNNHHCDLRDISYEQVKDGTLWCRECGRIWDVVNTGEITKWVPDPAPPMSPSQVAAMRRPGKSGKRR